MNYEFTAKVIILFKKTKEVAIKNRTYLTTNPISCTKTKLTTKKTNFI